MADIKGESGGTAEAKCVRFIECFRELPLGQFKIARSNLGSSCSKIYPAAPQKWNDSGRSSRHDFAWFVYWWKFDAPPVQSSAVPTAGGLFQFDVQVFVAVARKSFWFSGDKRKVFAPKRVVILSVQARWNWHGDKCEFALVSDSHSPESETRQFIVGESQQPRGIWHSTPVPTPDPIGPCEWQSQIVEMPDCNPPLRGFSSIGTMKTLDGDLCP
ncbi:hypothetical protein [Roseibacillus ishigakijimensis]|uniref:Uncharacterized protein n=1 Tax=Roseibacillus ishigakijimensis TaxID=454146 RepID=A0A934VH34_9BACT|nr:hypothetical protein [Roseibacillus ishigakijimensis]MBK1833523.1 hypothetical protein [Roseibacillus ishigakijimensis]